MAGTEPCLRKVIGSPAVGPDFWPRPDVVDRLFDDLTMATGSRRLFALRRIGKTSVLLELERRLRGQEGLAVIRVDVQGLNRFADFLTKVFEQIPVEGRLREARRKLAGNGAARTLISGLWGRIAGRNETQAQSGFASEFDHQAAWAGDIEAALKEAGPIVLLIDELPFMLRNMLRAGYSPSDAERFLAALRSWRINNGVRMLLSGSIGFAQLRRIDKVQVADHIGDVIPVSLPPLGQEQAVDMVDALARGEKAQGWSRALSAAIVDASAETWPIFLQCGFDALARTDVRDPAQVGKIVEGEVRPILDETFYQQFSTRLARYEGEARMARLVLKTVVASDADPTTFAAIDEALARINAVERRDDLLEALREDDFILFDTGAQTVRPASKLVPIWVRARAWGR